MDSHHLRQHLEKKARDERNSSPALKAGDELLQEVNPFSYALVNSPIK